MQSRQGQIDKIGCFCYIYWILVYNNNNNCCFYGFINSGHSRIRDQELKQPLTLLNLTGATLSSVTVLNGPILNL